MLQSHFLGLSRSGSGVGISIPEPNLAPGPVSLCSSSWEGHPRSGRANAGGSEF